jgi:hypothetical protein
VEVGGNAPATTGSLTMEAGSKITGHTGSTFTNGVVRVGGVGSTFTMKGGEISGNHSASTTVYFSAVSIETNAGFVMSGGTVSGNTNAHFTAGDPADITILVNASFTLSGPATVGALTLEKNSSENASVTLGGLYTGTVAALNLRGNTSIEETISNWENATLIKGGAYTPTANDIAGFTPGKFINLGSNAGTRPIAGNATGNNYYIGTAAPDIGKLLKVVKVFTRGQIITDLDDIEPYLAYIASQSGEGSPAENPIPLNIQLNLGTMTDANSNWQEVLKALAEANKFVELDLSRCSMNGTAFDPYFRNPDPLADGKAMIVHITLPDAAESIPNGNYGGPSTSIPFHKFTALESFSGTGLKTIGDYAFRGCANLAMTELPSTITSIGFGAFTVCTELALTSLPAGLSSIGAGAFSGCTKLALSSLPVGITTIDQSTFAGCMGITQMTLHSGLTSINNGAFAGTGLTRITLPSTLTSINAMAFQTCMSLELVTCLAETPPTLGEMAFTYWDGANIILPDLKIYVPAGSVGAYKSAWSAYEDRIFAIGTITSIAELAAFLESQTGGTTADNPVPLRLALDIGTMTDANSGWRQVLNVLAEADKYVDLDLSACAMNGTVFNPGYSVSTGKDKIVSIALPDAATGTAALEGGGSSVPFRYFDALKSFSGKNLTSIGAGAFQGLTSLTMNSLPVGITSIGASAFSGCTGLTEITLPEGLTSIGNFAFQNCTGLTEITLPEGLTSIGNSAFRSCTSLALTSLPSGVTAISNSAFEDCGLTQFTIHQGITSIGSAAFNSCPNLTTVTFEGTITGTNFNSAAPFLGDLRAKYLDGGPGTYTTTDNPVSAGSVWTKQ